MEIGKYSQISDPCKINYADNQNGILMAKTFGNYMKGGRRSVITKADLADGFREIPLISDERLSELLSPVYFNEPMADKMALLRREDYNNPGGSLWICETGGRHYSFREEMKKKGEKKIVNQIDTGEEKYRKIALSLDMKTIAGINDKGQLSIIRLGLKTGNVHAVGESYG